MASTNPSHDAISDRRFSEILGEGFSSATGRRRDPIHSRHSSQADSIQGRRRRSDEPMRAARSGQALLRDRAIPICARTLGSAWRGRASSLVAESQERRLHLWHFGHIRPVWGNVGMAPSGYRSGPKATPVDADRSVIKPTVGVNDVRDVSRPETHGL